jgi:hypothetical protein
MVLTADRAARSGRHVLAGRTGRASDCRRRSGSWLARTRSTPRHAVPRSWPSSRGGSSGSPTRIGSPSSWGRSERTGISARQENDQAAAGAAHQGNHLACGSGRALVSLGSGGPDGPGHPPFPAPCSAVALAGTVAAVAGCMPRHRPPDGWLRTRSRLDALENNRMHLQTPVGFATAWPVLAGAQRPGPRLPAPFWKLAGAHQVSAPSRRAALVAIESGRIVGTAHGDRGAVAVALEKIGARARSTARHVPPRPWSIESRRIVGVACGDRGAVAVILGPIGAHRDFRLPGKRRGNDQAPAVASDLGNHLARGSGGRTWSAWAVAARMAVARRSRPLALPWSSQGLRPLWRALRGRFAHRMGVVTSQSPACACEHLGDGAARPRPLGRERECGTRES